MSFAKRRRPETAKEDSNLQEGSDSEALELSKKLKGNDIKVGGVDLVHKEESKVEFRDAVESTLNSELTKNDFATTMYSVDTDVSKDHRALLEKNAEVARKIQSGELSAGLYHGKLARVPLVQKRENAPSQNKATAIGPARGQQYARAISRMDYQADICKDYKETGYCGWGDTCIFMHDRSEHKSSAQIEKEWQAAQQRKADKVAEIFARRLKGEQVDSEDEMNKLEEEEKKLSARRVYNQQDMPWLKVKGKGDKEVEPTSELPFACLICRKPWTIEANTVATRCNHYFCEKCAYGHFAKSEKCFTCQQPSLGIFNSVDADVMAKLLKLAEDKAAVAPKQDIS